MKLLLKRVYLGTTYTIGNLYINDSRFCDTVEDRVRDLNQDGDLNDPGESKVYGRTAIPYGKYEVDLTMSPKFTRLLPLVKNVNHFTGIRIHRGNTAEDSAGCILPGENKIKGRVINSTDWEMRIVEQMIQAIRDKEDITLEIV